MLYQHAYQKCTSQLGVFQAKFHINALLVELPNTSTRGHLSM